jgi:parallel beta-helix repeat protein
VPGREAIVVPSRSVLDCHGLELRPVQPRGPSDPEPTDPQVGLALLDARGATVRRCAITGFDFPILAAAGGEHAIEKNTIETRNRGISLLGSSRNRVRDNTVRFGTAGIALQRISNHNHIGDNRLMHASLSDQSVGDRIAPGFDFGFADGVGVIVLDGPFPIIAVVNVIVGARLLQLPAVLESISGNVVEDNRITLQREPDLMTRYIVGAYLAVKSQGTVFRRNVVTGGTDAIHMPGFGPNDPLAMAGRCAADPDRYCRGEPDWSDCHIADIDDESLGPCEFRDEDGQPVQVTCYWTRAPCASNADCPDAQFGEQCGHLVDSPGLLLIRDPLVQDNEVRDFIGTGIGVYHTTRARVLGAPGASPGAPPSRSRPSPSRTRR